MSASVKLQRGKRSDRQGPENLSFPVQPKGSRHLQL